MYCTVQNCTEVHCNTLPHSTEVNSSVRFCAVYPAGTALVFERQKAVSIVASRDNNGPLRQFCGEKIKEKEKKAEFTYSMLQIGRKFYADCVTHEITFLLWEKKHYRQLVGEEKFQCSQHEI